MKGPSLTVGMAVFDDYNGVYFSTQALRAYHDLSDVEILIVDNNPSSEEGRLTAEHLESRGPERERRYIPMPGATGTTQPRERVFKEAKGDMVLCMDAHVLLMPGAITELVALSRSGADEGNMITGPLLCDDMIAYFTHFDLVWRHEMWGIWATAWRCHCGEGVFSSSEDDPPGDLSFYSLDSARAPITACPACGDSIPSGPSKETFAELKRRGFRRAAASPRDMPFEVPANGLGLFACRRSAWPGFNPHFREFGGEEGYIHLKFKKLGPKTVCYPWLRWMHRFGRPGGAKYPRSLWSKARNYVLGFRELGLSLESIHDHFVKEGQMPEAEWASLVDDPTRELPVVERHKERHDRSSD